MEDSQKSESRRLRESEAGLQRDPAARIAGVLLILTAVATVLAVAARVAADADQPTLAESLEVIAENWVLYGAGGVARLVSAITLIAGARYLARTWIVREGWGASLVPTLFVVSGVFTAISGASAAALAVTAPAASDPALLATGAATETIDLFRWLAGKIGFALAGLALLVAARQQWKGGGMLRRLSPVSAIVGLAMQFIWIDAATFMHPINGTAFVLWLVLIGSMLAGGSVERHFQAMRNATVKAAD